MATESVRKNNIFLQSSEKIVIKMVFYRFGIGLKENKIGLKKNGRYTFTCFMEKLILNYECFLTYFLKWNYEKETREIYKTIIILKNNWKN